jgi:hypothetical protein
MTTIILYIILAAFGALIYKACKAGDKYMANNNIKFVAMTGEEALRFNGVKTNSDTTEIGVSTSDMISNPVYDYMACNFNHHED